jgi:hypothetical protein
MQWLPISAAVGLAILLAIYSRLAPAPEIARSPAARAGALQPTLHADVYKKLATPVRLDFNEVTVVEIFRQLAESTGIDIENVDEPAPKVETKNPEQRITLTNPDPVTLQKAIQMTLIRSGNRFISLNDHGVRLLSRRQAEDGFVLQTHSLSDASEFTSLMRARFIEQVRREIAPDEWDRTDGPWIVPARSVFAVDVYHQPAVQVQIAKLWRREHPFDARYGNPSSPGMLYEKTASQEQIAALTQELREKYPFESILSRLAYEHITPPSKAPSVSPEVERQLAVREEFAARRGSPGSGTLMIRSSALKQLHSDEVAKFITRPGFGPSRRVTFDRGPGELPLAQLTPIRLPSAEIDPPSPELPVSLRAVTPVTAAGVAVLPAVDRLERLHQAGVGSFLSSFRFGYVKDREHVAGFGPHGFEYLPRLEQLELSQQFAEPTEHWAVRKLELVSLLKHDTPRAYSSEKLPQMEELQGVPTRPLNDFENNALPRLIESEDVVARATTNRIEMVGAIRADKQCTECHEVHRGQLLGAFTYTLVRDPWIPPAAKNQVNRPNPLTQ